MFSIPGSRQFCERARPPLWRTPTSPRRAGVVHRVTLALNSTHTGQTVRGQTTRGVAAHVPRLPGEPRGVRTPGKPAKNPAPHQEPHAHVRAGWQGTGPPFFSSLEKTVCQDNGRSQSGELRKLGFITSQHRTRAKQHPDTFQQGGPSSCMPIGPMTPYFCSCICS